VEFEVVNDQNKIVNGKVKFWSKMAIGAIIAKLFLHIFSHNMNLNFKQK
jgi:hypothetical protein